MPDSMIEFFESASGNVYIHAVRAGRSLCGHKVTERWFKRDRPLWDSHPADRCPSCALSLAQIEV